MNVWAQDMPGKFVDIYQCEFDLGRGHQCGNRKVPEDIFCSEHKKVKCYMEGGTIRIVKNCALCGASRCPIHKCEYSTAKHLYHCP